jgi:hypothetical protein
VSPSDTEHGEVEVVLDAQGEEEPGGLVGAGQSRARPLPGRLSRHIPPEELDLARRGKKLAGDEIEQGCLPGPVRTQNGATLTRVYVEVHPPYSVHTPEAPADPP